jgi:DNA replication protein DnaC
MSEAPQLLLAHHLKALKLPTFLREHEKLARQCAAEGADHLRYLLRLAELELIEREQRTVERRIREAHFPTIKSLDSFDFQAIPSLNKALVLELARGEYIERRENVIALGNSGTGKTHVALGLGLAACQRGYSVGFTTAAALVHELLEARDEKRLLRLQKQLIGYKLLIIDELGFVPLSKSGAELLFEIFSQRSAHLPTRSYSCRTQPSAWRPIPDQDATDGVFQSPSAGRAGVKPGASGAPLRGCGA